MPYQLIEFFAGLLERFEERFLEPQWERPPPDRVWEAWFEYRLERLERRQLWLLRLLLAHAVMDLVLWWLL